MGPDYYGHPYYSYYGGTYSSSSNQDQPFMLSKNGAIHTLVVFLGEQWVQINY